MGWGALFNFLLADLYLTTDDGKDAIAKRIGDGWPARPSKAEGQGVKVARSFIVKQKQASWLILARILSAGGQ